jgi:hypothetical protein
MEFGDLVAIAALDEPGDSRAGANWFDIFEGKGNLSSISPRQEMRIFVVRAVAHGCYVPSSPELRVMSST